VAFGPIPNPGVDKLSKPFSISQEEMRHGLPQFADLAMNPALKVSSDPIGLSAD
jgi:hypothetical protein